MAQVDTRTFERLRAMADMVGAGSGTQGAAGVADGGLRRLAAALRVSEVPHGVLVAILVLALAAAVLGAVFLGRVGTGVTVVRGQGSAAVVATTQDSAPNAGADGTELDAAGESDADPVEAALLTVHVAGAVVHPGVYALPDGSRVCDAVEAAGGFAEGADADAINLAEPVLDGCKVTVPTVGETLQMATSMGVQPAGSTGSGASSTGLVNINTATAEELQTLPGVGESIAAAIVEDRAANGAFATPEDLMRVSGIGEKKFENMRAQVVV